MIVRFARISGAWLNFGQCGRSYGFSFQEIRQVTAHTEHTVTWRIFVFCEPNIKLKSAKNTELFSMGCSILIRVVYR